MDDQGVRAQLDEIEVVERSDDRVKVGLKQLQQREVGDVDGRQAPVTSSPSCSTSTCARRSITSGQPSQADVVKKTSGSPSSRARSGLLSKRPQGGGLRQAFASSYCETTDAGMRPRSLTWIP
jgi:hypothetical protein